MRSHGPLVRPLGTLVDAYRRMVSGYEVLDGGHRLLVPGDAGVVAHQAVLHLCGAGQVGGLLVGDGRRRDVLVRHLPRHPRLPAELADLLGCVDPLLEPAERSDIGVRPLRPAVAEDVEDACDRAHRPADVPYRVPESHQPLPATIHDSPTMAQGILPRMATVVRFRQPRRAPSFTCTSRSVSE